MCGLSKSGSLATWGAEALGNKLLQQVLIFKQIRKYKYLCLQSGGFGLSLPFLRREGIP